MEFLFMFKGCFCVLSFFNVRISVLVGLHVLCSLILLAPLVSEANNAPVVNRFEWSPSIFVSGQSTTFYWDISNVRECYGVTAINPEIPRPISGSSGPFGYVDPQVFTTRWYCIDLIGNRFPSNPSEFLTATRTTLATAPAPVVKQFEWIPSTITVGQATTFYWDVENVRECYGVTAIDPSKAQPAKGSSGPWPYTESSTFTTRWYCIDFAGNRYPANPNQYLEAVRNVVLPRYTVTATAGTGGAINPSSHKVNQGDTTSFTISVNNGYEINAASGCNGSRNGTQYYTGIIMGNCTVNVSFIRTATTGGVQYIHTDILGSVVAESDEDGAIKKRTDYKPFGETKNNE
jgi:hypothetical protein